MLQQRHLLNWAFLLPSPSHRRPVSCCRASKIDDLRSNGWWYGVSYDFQVKVLYHYAILTSCKMRWCLFPFSSGLHQFDTKSTTGLLWKSVFLAATPKWEYSFCQIHIVCRRHPQFLPRNWEVEWPPELRPATQVTQVTRTVTATKSFACQDSGSGYLPGPTFRWVTSSKMINHIYHINESQDSTLMIILLPH